MFRHTTPKEYFIFCLSEPIGIIRRVFVMPTDLKARCAKRMSQFQGQEFLHEAVFSKEELL